MNLKAARAFWKWFAKHEAELKRLLDTDSMKLPGVVGPELDKFSPGLGWEIGPGRTEPYMFSVCSVGSSKAELLVSAAPVLAGWEFFDSRQPRPLGKFRLVSPNVWVHPETWKIKTAAHPDEERIDILVVANEFGPLTENQCYEAIFLALDMLLGERQTEECIGGIEFLDHAELDGLRPFTDLKGYLDDLQRRNNRDE